MRPLLSAFCAALVTFALTGLAAPAAAQTVQNADGRAQEAYEAIVAGEYAKAERRGAIIELQQYLLSAAAETEAMRIRNARDASWRALSTPPRQFAAIEFASRELRPRRRRLRRRGG